MGILAILVLTVLISILSVLLGWILGVKFAELFDCKWMAAVGPIAALAIGLGFGMRDLGLLAGATAGGIGFVGSIIALIRSPY